MFFLSNSDLILELHCRFHVIKNVPSIRTLDAHVGGRGKKLYIIFVIIMARRKYTCLDAGAVQERRRKRPRLRRVSEKSHGNKFLARKSERKERCV